VVVVGDHPCNLPLIFGVGHGSQVLAYVFFDNFVGYIVRLVFLQIFPNSRNGVKFDVQIHFLQCLQTGVNEPSKVVCAKERRTRKNAMHRPGPDVRQLGQQ
jgi:hypothetical protein